MLLWLLCPLQLYVLPLLDALSVMVGFVQVSSVTLGFFVMPTVGAVLFKVKLTLVLLVQPLEPVAVSV